MQKEITKTSRITERIAVLGNTYKAAAWLGWQIESNWTDAFTFAIYMVIKPLSSAAILVVMYSIITNGAFENPIFPYIYLGNAFYIYVGAIMNGISFTVIDDREHFRMLKYIYVAPLHIPTYLLGRGVAQFIFGTLSVAITLLAGVLFLNVPLVLSNIDWGLFALSLTLGVIMLNFMGLILGSVTLLTVHHVWSLGGVVAGALYLFSGAIFPLDLLPAWMRPIGFAMPLTYWLELMRRSLLGTLAEAFPTLADFSNLELIGILAGLSLVFGVLSYFVFRFCDHRARELGYIDRVTNY
ncbi:MAG: ABC transporter permease [Anaerolineales bacterium]|jgi:ABC-2 type transport system permease protein